MTRAALKVFINMTYNGPLGDVLQPPNYRPGGYITLQCVVEGASGYESYYWTTTCVSGCFVYNGYSGNTLYQSFLRYNDAGIYICRVTDGIGNTGQDSQVINIMGKFEQ